MKPRTTSSESTVPVFVTVTRYDTRGAAAATTSLEGNLRPALEMPAKGARVRARVLDGEKKATDTSASDQLRQVQGWRAEHMCCNGRLGRTTHFEVVARRSRTGSREMLLAVAVMLYVNVV
jgi:hypothetical protein